MNLSIDDITNAIANYDNDIVENYVNSNFNNLNNIDLLEVALINGNFHAFVKLYSIVDIEDKNDYFIHSLSCLPIAMFLLETHADYYQTQNNMVDLPEKKISSEEYYFLENSKLPKYYENEQCDNNKQAFTALILKHALDSEFLKESNIEVVDYIFKNRAALEIKDKLIVQCIVENNYALYQECYDENEPISGYDLETKENLETMLYLLIENNIDCSSDMNGYLIQLVSYNKLDNMSEILTSVAALGSNPSGFLERIKHDENWLTAKEENDLRSRDYNQNRTYDIYKKFDKVHKIDQRYIDFCERLKNYINLENKIPNKQNNVTKLKI